MHEISFDDAVKTICERDKRIDRDAYYFLREALEATVSKLRNDETPEHQHVNGPELLDGLRDYALAQYGPLTATVLERWGLRATGDIGRMVFQLIEIGAFGQSDEDEPEDFVDHYDFDEAFREPFRPKSRKSEGEGAAASGEVAKKSRQSKQTEAAGGEDAAGLEDPELL